ncbi:MAG: metallophosphoesterase [bacterium]
MKKMTIFIFALLLLALVSCRAVNQDIVYSDDEPFVVEMASDTLKIIQFTDLHLTYGIDANDRKTFQCIETLVKSDTFDLVVITGDLWLSIAGTGLFSRFIRFMEGLETPWTFVFGNHETDHLDYVDYLNRIPADTEYLMFKVGPELEAGGVGNFRIVFTKDGSPFYNLYFFDSHTERAEYTEEEGEYDYVHAAQVAWYEGHAAADDVDSVAFMHIPLRQFIDPVDYVGTFNEDKVYAQGVDTGLFAAMVAIGKTKGVFVGHDHLNDFYVVIDGIYLAYGRITGYNAYGNLERGGRIIEIDSAMVMSTYVLLESEA